MPFSSDLTPKRFAPCLLGLLALALACGPNATPDALDDTSVVAESALTRALESGVARRTYGDKDQTRSYRLTVNTEAATLAVDLTGTGRVTLKAASPDGTVTCTRSGDVMDHHCSFSAPTTGTWTVDVSGLADNFSGSLVVTLVNEDPQSGHGPLNNGAEISPHTTLGVPDVASMLLPEHLLLVKNQLVISYNARRKIPNWVSWQLTKNWLGDAARSSTFTVDAQVPSSTPQATNVDYDNTGFARGHMCPSGDRTDSSDDNKSTFLLTNVVPQKPNLNNGPWKGLENESRQLANAGKTLFVTSGPIFGDTTIGAGVNVPVATWKVVVVVDEPSATSASVTDATRVIAVIMPNDSSATKEWHAYRTTVRDIESKTGLNLLSDVASRIQDVVENRVDTENPQ